MLVRVPLGKVLQFKKIDALDKLGSVNFTCLSLPFVIFNKEDLRSGYKLVNTKKSYKYKYIYQLSNRYLIK